MRTYYRGPDAVVTSVIFLGNGAPARKYAIRDLKNVCITHSDVAGSQPSPAHVTGGLLIIAVAAWPLWQASPIYAAGLVVLGLPALAAGAAFWRLRPRRWELRATYRGTDVVLYTSSDERVFNQVSRALRRAIEDARPPLIFKDVAAA